MFYKGVMFFRYLVPVSGSITDDDDDDLAESCLIGENVPELKLLSACHI